MTHDPTPLSTSDRPAPPPHVVRWFVALLRVVVPLAVIAIGAYGATILFDRKPEPTRKKVEAIATLVETIVPTPGDGMAEIIAGLTLEDTGTPTNVDGATIPW